MPSDTIAVAITDNASTPGTRKSTGSEKFVVTASTLAKNTSTPIGTASVTIAFSPRRICSVISARAWAVIARVLTGAPASLRP